MPANDVLVILMFLAFIGLIFTGFPIAWVLGGLAVFFTAVAIILEIDFGVPLDLDWAYTSGHAGPPNSARHNAARGEYTIAQGVNHEPDTKNDH